MLWIAKDQSNLKLPLLTPELRRAIERGNVVVQILRNKQNKKWEKYRSQKNLVTKLKKEAKIFTFRKTLMVEPKIKPFCRPSNPFYLIKDLYRMI